MFSLPFGSVSPRGYISTVIPDLWSQLHNGLGTSEWSQHWKYHPVVVARSVVANVWDAPRSPRVFSALL